MYLQDRMQVPAVVPSVLPIASKDHLLQETSAFPNNKLSVCERLAESSSDHKCHCKHRLHCKVNSAILLGWLSRIICIGLPLYTQPLTNARNYSYASLLALAKRILPRSAGRYCVFCSKGVRQACPTGHDLSFNCGKFSAVGLID